jgi:hypothetical protein
MKFVIMARNHLLIPLLQLFCVILKMYDSFDLAYEGILDAAVQNEGRQGS